VHSISIFHSSKHCFKYRAGDIVSDEDTGVVVAEAVILLQTLPLDTTGTNGFKTREVLTREAAAAAAAGPGRE
jgi:hypothetical protein